MFSDEGKQRLLESLKSWGCRLQFSQSEMLWPPDPGYPKVGQLTPDNPYGGDRVFTWKFTVPRATALVPTQSYRLIDSDGKVVFTSALQYPFTVSMIAPSVLYVNITLENK